MWILFSLYQVSRYCVRKAVLIIFKGLGSLGLYTLYIKRKLHYSREESFQNQLFCVITGGTTLELRKPIPRENPTMPYSMLTQKMCIFLPMTLLIIILYDLLKNKSLFSQYFHWVSFGTAAILSGMFTGKLKSQNLNSVHTCTPHSGLS